MNLISLVLYFATQLPEVTTKKCDCVKRVKFHFCSEDKIPYVVLKKFSQDLFAEALTNKIFARQYNLNLQPDLEFPYKWDNDNYYIRVLLFSGCFGTNKVCFCDKYSSLHLHIIDVLKIISFVNQHCLLQNLVDYEKKLKPLIKIIVKNIKPVKKEFLSFDNNKMFPKINVNASVQSISAYLTKKDLCDKKQIDIVDVMNYSKNINNYLKRANTLTSTVDNPILTKYDSIQTTTEHPSLVKPITENALFPCSLSYDDKLKPVSLCTDYSTTLSPLKKDNNLANLRITYRSGYVINMCMCWLCIGALLLFLLLFFRVAYKKLCKYKIF